MIKKTYNNDNNNDNKAHNYNNTDSPYSLKIQSKM